MRRIVLDIAARVDTVAIVNTSFLNFRLQASIRYSQLISQAYLDLADAPQRPGARAFEGGIYLYHLRNSRTRRISADRVARPRHLIAYRFDDEVIQIIRVLHDRMDVAAHLPGSSGR